MWPAFPTSDYYGTSATPVRHQATLTLPGLFPGFGRSTDASHVHRAPLVGVVVQLCSCSLAARQRSPTRGLARLINNEPTELERHQQRRSTHCAGPCRPGLGPLTNRGVSAAGSLALHRPTLLARPRRLVVPLCRYIVRAAPASRCNSSSRLPSASPGLLRQSGVGLSTHAETRRFVAHC